MLLLGPREVLILLLLLMVPGNKTFGIIGIRILCVFTFYFLFFLLTVLSYFVISSCLIYVPLIIIIFFLRLSVHNFDLSHYAFLFFFFSNAILFFFFFLFFCGFVLNLSRLFWDFFWNIYCWVLIDLILINVWGF